MEKTYFLGIGNEFAKNQCKKYKSLQAALNAAKKDENLVVWDEDGKRISENKEDKEELEAEKESALETAVEDMGSDGKQEERKEKREVKNKIIKVIFDGKLRLRRSESWEDSEVCGMIAKGSEYRLKRMVEVDGKMMAETAEGLFISADENHVEIIEK